MRKIPFEINKFVKGVTKCVYRDGKEAQVIRIDPENPQPILSTDKSKKLFRHYTNGIHLEDKSESSFDLFIVVERIVRSWTFDEVPVGAVIRPRGLDSIKYKIVEKMGHSVLLEPDRKQYSIGQLTEYWNYSLDDGKTWKVCGVVIQE